MQQNWSIEYMDVKSIIQLKKTLTLGQVPDDFNIVANKLKELEGTFTDGFANNITYLLNPQNWQLKNCINGKPQVVLVQQITPYAFDLHCFPLINHEIQAMVKDYHPKSGFKEFNPASIGPIVRIPKLSELIELYIRCPDDADLALLKYAHMLIQQTIELIEQRLEVVEIRGLSIQKVATDIQQQIPQNQMG
ncbi:hypothetical protein [Paraglaciecola aestuariivivens]